MTILVGTTLAAYVMDQPDTWSAWLQHAEQVRDSVDVPVEFFAAIETDARGLDPFDPLIQWLDALDQHSRPDARPFWTFHLDDGRTEITTANRLRHITNGQNLVVDRAVSDPDVSHLLFVAADCRPPADVLPRLLEMDCRYVGAYCPTYCLHGEPDEWELTGDRWAPIEHVMPSAACVLIERDVFRRLRWRWDPVDGSDDPCYYLDAQELLGVEGITRMDVIADHFPQAVPPIEHRGHDRTVAR